MDTCDKDKDQDKDRRDLTAEVQRLSDEAEAFRAANDHKQAITALKKIIGMLASSGHTDLLNNLGPFFVNLVAQHFYYADEVKEGIKFFKMLSDIIVATDDESEIECAILWHLALFHLRQKDLHIAKSHLSAMLDVCLRTKNYQMHAKVVSTLGFIAMSENRFHGYKGDYHSGQLDFFFVPS
jgi:hypothetical protein